MIYTSGDWHVVPGQENDFVDAWHEFAQWSVEEIDHTVQATLLRDAEDSSHFVSFGNWPDDETIERWRESAGYREYISQLKGMTESMKIATLSVVAQTELISTSRR